MMPAVALRHRQIFFSRDTVLLGFFLVPYETWQLQPYGDPCNPPANLLFALVPWHVHSVSFISASQISKLSLERQTIPSPDSSYGAGLFPFLWTPLYETKLPYYDTGKIWSAPSARCWEDVFSHLFATWGWNKGWFFFPWLVSSCWPGTKSLFLLVLLDLSSNDLRDLLTCRWALLTLDGVPVVLRFLFRQLPEDSDAFMLNICCHFVL